MSKIKITKSAEYTYQKVMWKAQIEYNGKLYNIFTEEDDNSAEFTVYIPDPKQSWMLGEEVKDENLVEEIYEILSENGATSPSEIIEGQEYEI